MFAKRVVGSGFDCKPGTVNFICERCGAVPHSRKKKFRTISEKRLAKVSKTDPTTELESEGESDSMGVKLVTDLRQRHINI